MRVSTLSPFWTFGGMERELKTLFDRIGSMASPSDENVDKAWKWTPRVDISRKGDELVIEAEVPGVDPSDIEVSIDQGVLTIKGERKAESEREDETRFVRERFFGSFRRSITLPDDVDADAIHADHDNGILVVRVALPTPAERGSRTIPVGTQRTLTAEMDSASENGA